jgi:hypothetical protein
MTTLVVENTEKLEKLGIKAFTDELLKNYYPQLFLLLNQIDHFLQTIVFDLDVHHLQAVHVKMNGEMEEIYRKEKNMLFPLLLQLDQEHKTSDSCKPFKKVKYHFTYLVSTAQQFKTLLNQFIDDRKKTEELNIIKGILLEFEQAVIRIQACKEKYLFKPFRNCSGSCKLI